MRRRMPPITAVRVDSERTVEAQGVPRLARAGDYLIMRGPTVLDVVSPKELDQHYEAIVEGGLTLPPSACQAIERTTGISTTHTVAALVGAIERLAQIHVGGVRVEFTPGQLEEIAHRAAKRGRTVQQELQAVVDRIKDEIFWKG